jgi:hypothetical protein
MNIYFYLSEIYFYLVSLNWIKKEYEFKFHKGIECIEEFDRNSKRSDFSNEIKELLLSIEPSLEDKISDSEIGTCFDKEQAKEDLYNTENRKYFLKIVLLTILLMSFISYYTLS